MSKEHPVAKQLKIIAKNTVKGLQSSKCPVAQVAGEFFPKDKPSRKKTWKQKR